MKPSNDPVDLDSILRTVNDEVARREAQGPPPHESRLEKPLHPESKVPTVDLAPRSLEGVLCFQDEAFVRAAYRCVLNRDPDKSGLSNYLSLLRSGKIRKVELLGALRSSPEGRKCGTFLPGLERAYFLSRVFRVPVVGDLLKSLHGFLPLSVVLTNAERFEASSDGRISLPADQSEERHAAQDNHDVLVRLQESVAELQRQLTRMAFSKADRTALMTLSEDVQRALSEKPDRADLPEFSMPKDLGLELQRQLSRLEYTKADRTTISDMVAQISIGLEAKADQRHLEDSVEGIRAAGKEQYEFIAKQLEGAQQQYELIVKQLALTASENGLSGLSLRLSVLEDSSVDPFLIQQMEGAQKRLEKQSEDLKRTLLNQERRLSIFLEQARKRLPEPFSAEQVRDLVKEDDHFLDALYVSFEDRFRGMRGDIKDRCRVFLPYVQDALRSCGNAPVLDMACGRGEWLELLQDSGIQALGIDFNRVLVGQCGEYGLAVTEADAVQFLREQATGSFSVVSSFHFIEHVTFRVLITIMDETLRVLKPGGLAIFETPNARNLLVTAGDFYRDPTHQRPLFPDTLEALAEYRGFANSTVYCFNAARTELQRMSDVSFNDLSDYISVSRDAVWMGTKAL